MITKEMMQQLLLAAVPVLMDAHKHGHSMAEIELDPHKLFDFDSDLEGAGKVFIAIAGGPSIQTLKSALLLTERPN